METIANLWWLWLAGALVTLLYGAYNQISRMRRMMSGDAGSVGLFFKRGQPVLESMEQSFFKGIAALVIAAVLNMGFVVLLVVSIVLNIISYAKH